MVLLPARENVVPCTQVCTLYRSNWSHSLSLSLSLSLSSLIVWSLPNGGFVRRVLEREKFCFYHRWHLPMPLSAPVIVFVVILRERTRGRQDTKTSPAKGLSQFVVWLFSLSLSLSLSLSSFYSLGVTDSLHSNERERERERDWSLSLLMWIVKKHRSVTKKKKKQQKKPCLRLLFDWSWTVKTQSRHVMFHWCLTLSATLFLSLSPSLSTQKTTIKA